MSAWKVAWLASLFIIRRVPYPMKLWLLATFPVVFFSTKHLADMVAQGRGTEVEDIVTGVKTEAAERDE